MVVGRDDNRFGAIFRAGNLNRGGGFDARNTVTPVALDLLSIDLEYSREFGGGRVEIGAGFQGLENVAGGSTTTDLRAYLSWSIYDL